MFNECCILYVLFIDKCENGWKSYGNNCYLFGLNKLNWHDAKVYKIVINKNKVQCIYISIVLLSREKGWGPINQCNDLTPTYCCACPKTEPALPT